jgi:hypothetical protein
MSKIKQVENKHFIIKLVAEDECYVVKYKRKSMKDFSYMSFSDLKYANIMFENTLIELEGH